MEQFCVHDKTKQDKKIKEITVPPQNSDAPVDNFELLRKGKSGCRAKQTNRDC
jgi:hypothetical protein